MAKKKTHTTKKPAKTIPKKAKVSAPKRAAQKPPEVKTVAASPSTPPDFGVSLDEVSEDVLPRLGCGSREYVLRTQDGAFLHEVGDLVIANQLARALSVRVKVFKRTPTGEVLMSYSGPGKWN